MIAGDVSRVDDIPTASLVCIKSMLRRGPRRETTPQSMREALRLACTITCGDRKSFTLDHELVIPQQMAMIRKSFSRRRVEAYSSDVSVVKHSPAREIGPRADRSSNLHRFAQVDLNVLSRRWIQSPITDQNTAITTSVTPLASRKIGIEETVGCRNGSRRRVL